jgi:hypothetical protein
LSVNRTGAESTTLANHSARKEFWFAAVMCLGLYFSVISFTTQNYGKLQSSSEIARMFENVQILSKHFYDYSGLQGVPESGSHRRNKRQLGWNKTIASLSFLQSHPTCSKPDRG